MIPAIQGFRRLPASFLAVVIGIASAPTCRAEPSESDAEARRQELHLYLKGRHVFQSQCVPCHGRTGRGDGPWAPELQDKPRNFRVGLFKFRTTPFGKQPTEDDLRRTIRKGISGTAMPSFKKLTEDEVGSVIVYLRNLSKRWDDPEFQAKPLSLPETPEWFRVESERADHSRAGHTLFQTHCISCHGTEGKGDGPASGELVDVLENKITPGNLTREHHKSGDDPADLFRTIVTGLNGTPMIGFRELLSNEQVWDLVAWIKSIEAPEKKLDHDR